MSRLLLFLAFLVSACSLCAQVPADSLGNSPISEPPVPVSPTGSRLSFDFDATTFFRDAEFFLPETEGYTASGFRITPLLHYQIDEKTSLSAGLRLTGIAGTDGLAKVQPVVTFDYSPTSWLQLVMGTIKGSSAHNLGEPMYDIERWYYDFQEDGLQILTHTKHWQSDTWVNWEHFLYPWTADQERFTLGSVHDIALLHISNRKPVTILDHNEEFCTYRIHDIDLTLPLAFVGCHRGGQFSTLDTCIETLFNESIGVKADWTLGQPNHLSFEASWYFYQNNSPESHTPFDDGHAFYPQLHFSHACLGKGHFPSDPEPHTSPKIDFFDFSLGYFRGHQYISPRGSYLFQSISWSDPNFIQPDRDLITADLRFIHMFGAFSLNLNAQFYYDLSEHQLDFAFGLIMDFHKRFPIRLPRASSL